MEKNELLEQLQPLFLSDDNNDRVLAKGLLQSNLNLFSKEEIKDFIFEMNMKRTVKRYKKLNERINNKFQ